MNLNVFDPFMFETKITKARKEKIYRMVGLYGSRKVHPLPGTQQYCVRRNLQNKRLKKRKLKKLRGFDQDKADMKINKIVSKRRKLLANLKPSLSEQEVKEEIERRKRITIMQKCPTYYVIAWMI